LDQQQATKRFYGLVWPHLATVLRTARFLVGNAAEAEDIAQVTMMKAFKSIDSLQDATDTKAWLMTILRNTRIDHLRSGASSARNVSLGQLPIEPADSRPSTVHDADDWQNPTQLLQAFSDQQVIAALLQLPEDIRWTLLLVDVEQMDHKDAARILDVPVGTVKSRTHRGRAMLRQSLTPLAREMRLIRQEGN
jgi:RNA polymerase sigma-70 factor, ECF subfamily